MKIKTLFDKDETVSLETYLHKRGIDNVNKYIKPPVNVLDDCYIYDNMREAVTEIKYHIINNHKFCIVIDSDADGYTSAYIMYKYIRLQNPKCKVKMIIQDGKIRGLDSEKTRRQVIDCKPDCLILPDSGTNSAPYAQELFDNGIALTILDHHAPSDEVCKDWGIVVNNQMNHLECNTELSGCGVTFKFLQALDKEFGTKYSNRFIDLVGISIISDSMDVRTYENRWFVKYILDDKEHIENSFMYELFDKLGNTYNQRDISFKVVPLINSVIRCGTIEEKQQLFLAFDSKNVDDTVKMCHHYHQEQMTIVSNFIEHHRAEINEQANSNITVIDAKDIPQNFSGLIAGKISGLTNKPCIVGKTIKGELSGSFRGNISIKTLRDLPSVVFAQGHSGACGIRLKTQNLDDFRTSVDKMDISTEREVIASYSANKLQMGLFNEFIGHEDLWGKELDKPKFYVYNVRVNEKNSKVMGSKFDTLKVILDGYEIMFFKLSQTTKDKLGIDDFSDEDYENPYKRFPTVTGEYNINLIGTLNVNTWRGKKTNQIFAEDFEIEEVTNTFEDLM
jgi:single-stranded-DNA-specific exonuclease